MGKAPVKVGYARKGWMCANDFDCELGHIVCEVYGSEEELRRKRPCVTECGVVEVEVKVVGCE